MVILGRIRRWQVDENPELELLRPAKTTRVNDFFKAILVHATRAQLEWVCSWLCREFTNWCTGEKIRKSHFDITKNTIMDSTLQPEEFLKIRKVIYIYSKHGKLRWYLVLLCLTSLPTVLSIIRAVFCWNWQCTTLNRSEEMLNLHLCCLQPYTVNLPDFTTVHRHRAGPGRSFFGVLAIYRESKTVWAHFMLGN